MRNLAEPAHCHTVAYGSALTLHGVTIPNGPLFSAGATARPIGYYPPTEGLAKARRAGLAHPRVHTVRMARLDCSARGRLRLVPGATQRRRP